MGDVYIVADEDKANLLDQPLHTYQQAAGGGIDRIAAQATEFLGAADACEVLDQRTLEAAVEVLKDLKRLTSDFEVARKAVVEPLNQVVKEINSAAKEVYDERGKGGKLDDAEAKLKGKIAAYLEANPDAKAEGVYSAKRYTYKIINAAMLKIDYMEPNTKALQAVANSMGKLAEKATARRKTAKAIEVEEISDLRVRTK